MSLQALQQQAEETFQKVFGERPDRFAAAPGRVNLIGEHTDYNDGYVLPMAIDRHVVLAARSRSSSNRPQWTIHSAGLNETATFSLDSQDTPGWCRYLQGVLITCRSRALDPGGFDAVLVSDVPLGGGLSSSAAIEVATATLAESFAGKQLDPAEKARLCQQAENEHAGVPCGIMDQFASVFGSDEGALLVDCRSLELEVVPLDGSSLAVLISNTGVRHALADGEYAKRRASCEEAAAVLGAPSLRDVTREELEQARPELDPVLYRRARHVISENARTLETVRALRADELEQVGELLHASHASLRDDYEVSCPELDILEAHARSIGPAGGVLGARMTGGGFGGSTVSLVRREAVETVTESLRTAYREATGNEPAIFAARPAAGARVLGR